MMSTVLLGSEAPKAPELGTQASVNGEEVESDLNVDLPARTIVLIDTPDFDADGNKVPLDKKLMEVRNAFALHSSDGASWVEGEESGFTGAVGQVFDCEVGRPNDWDEKPAAEKPQTEGTPTVSQVEVNPDDGMVN
jgi:hypothetical protein